MTKVDKVVAKAKLLGLQSQILFDGAAVITYGDNLYKIHKVYVNGVEIPREYTEVKQAKNCLMCRYMKKIDRGGITRGYTYLVDVYYYLNGKLVRILPKRAIKDVDYMFSDELGLDALIIWGNQNILMKPTTGEYIELKATHLQHIKFKKLYDEKPAILVYQFTFLQSNQYITYDFKETNDKKMFNLNEIKRQVY